MKFAWWLTKTMLAAAIVAVVSVATTWAVVNAYVQQLLGMYGAADAAKTVSLGDALSAMFPDPAAGPGPAVGAGAAVAEEDAQEKPEPGAEEPGEGAAPTETAPTPDEYPVPDDALPVMGQAAQSEDEMLLSPEQLNERKDSISEEERMEIFAMLVSKLPPEEVQQISALLEDGLLAEELESASTILQQYLTEEEFARLVDILQQ